MDYTKYIMSDNDKETLRILLRNRFIDHSIESVEKEIARFLQALSVKITSTEQRYAPDYGVKIYGIQRHDEKLASISFQFSREDTCVDKISVY